MVCAFNALHGVNPNWGQYKVHVPHAHTRAARSNVQGRGSGVSTTPGWYYGLFGKLPGLTMN